MFLLKIFLFLKYLPTFSFRFCKKLFMRIVLEKLFEGAHTCKWPQRIYIYIYIYIYLYTYTYIHIYIWPNDKVCLTIYRIKSSQSWSHDTWYIYILFIYMIFIMHCVYDLFTYIVLHIYIYICYICIYICIILTNLSKMFQTKPNQTVFFLFP